MKKRKMTKTDAMVGTSRVSVIVYEDGTRLDVAEGDHGTFTRKDYGPLMDDSGKPIAYLETTVTLEGQGLHSRRDYVAGWEGL